MMDGPAGGSGLPPVIPYAAPDERAAARERVRRHLTSGGLVAYPTETVYGLGCALLPGALRRLREIKGDRPFLLLVTGRQQVAELAWNETAARLAERFWPGPLTLALPAPADSYPGEVVGPEGLVAVRVSPHPAVAALLEAAGGAVTSTSANRPGGEPARSAESAAAALSGLADLLVLDGGTLPPGQPSTIVRCGGGRARILREGAIERETIAATAEVE